MGACIGKKNSKKYIKHDQSNAVVNRSPQPKLQDNISQEKASPTPSKKLQMAEGIITDDNDDLRISKIDDDSIASDLQMIMDEQKIIYQVLNQPFSIRVVSATDTELEFELANLINEFSLNDHLQNPPSAVPVKPADT